MAMIQLWNGIYGIIPGTTMGENEGLWSYTHSYTLEHWHTPNIWLLQKLKTHCSSGITCLWAKKALHIFMSWEHIKCCMCRVAINDYSQHSCQRNFIHVRMFFVILKNGRNNLSVSSDYKRTVGLLK